MQFENKTKYTKTRTSMSLKVKGYRETLSRWSYMTDYQ
jgi:hypothetical protein